MSSSNSTGSAGSVEPAPAADPTQAADPAQAAEPAEIRRIDTPAARALADLAGAFEDMQVVLACCERLLAQLQAGQVDTVAAESLWTTALLSYARCFAPGTRGTGLTEADLAKTGMAGELDGWHHALMRMREHFATPAANPRETFSVGAALDAQGAAVGVAVTSARRPVVDDLTVRQTGALAVALARLLDGRIAEQQKVVRTALETLSSKQLAQLPLLEVAAREGTGAAGTD